MKWKAPGTWLRQKHTMVSNSSAQTPKPWHQVTKSQLPVGERWSAERSEKLLLEWVNSENSMNLKFSENIQCKTSAWQEGFPKKISFPLRMALNHRRLSYSAEKILKLKLSFWSKAKDQFWLNLNKLTLIVYFPCKFQPIHRVYVLYGKRK